MAKLRSGQHWLVRETRCAVFIDVAGKVGHRWRLSVFHSPSVVHYMLELSALVPKSLCSRPCKQWQTLATWRWATLGSQPRWPRCL